MVEVDLTALALKYYGSRHYLFLILAANGLSLPAVFEAGDKLKLPPRGSTARLAAVELLKRDLSGSPV